MMGATKQPKQAQGAKKSKAKGRKIGRHRDRSPSAKVYKMTNRCDINRKKKAKRHARRMARLEIGKLEWAMSKGKVSLQACASRLIELRQVVAQNH